MAFLEVHNVSKQYSGHLALNDVSISVEKASIFGLLGPNGAGKTTLIRIINAITMPDSGEVLLDGKSLSLKDSARIGYLPEERGLYKKMKVGEQAMYLCQLKGLSKEEAQKRLKYWFEKFEIQGWWNKKVEELSKGMAQKIQFITTVLHEPELLIFDEPFSGFDPVNTELLKKEILELRDKGATIIFSTHNMDSVERICDDIALINHSQVVLSGGVQEIRSRFKKNIYRVGLSSIIGNLKLDENRFEIISSITSEDATEFKIKLYDGVTGNDLLKELLEIGNVTLFEEELPSMNDVFIETVTN